MKQKEVAKRRLERQVEQLRIQLNRYNIKSNNSYVDSEKKTTDEFEREYAEKISKLEKKIETASGMIVM